MDERVDDLYAEGKTSVIRSVEIAVVLRMVCGCYLPTGQPKQGMISVIFDNSDRAVALSLARSQLDEIVHRYGISPALSFSTSTSLDDIAKSVRSMTKSSATLPQVVAVEKLGIFFLGYSSADALAVRDGIMGKKEYQKQNHQQAVSGRLDKCIAVITGAAQGFGKGIAEELVREGAYVAVTDINDAAGMAAANELNTQYGPGSAMFCHCDVTNFDSILSMLTSVVHNYGGIDMFISNAGVLKAGSLDEMDEKAFDMVTAVNYKAYFLGVKAVSPIMKLQHTYNPNHTMDIIQINSKSGLEGSNKNFAYAGSKFGGIGLTQSFALELVEYGIKVNAICPGNYYEGPLWSDPQNGLFVQYLKAGKVPGAKTIEDVRNFYLSKVPMKKGCSPKDVAKAIFYCREQTNETGQALPVTGGQIMLA